MMKGVLPLWFAGAVAAMAAVSYAEVPETFTVLNWNVQFGQLNDDAGSPLRVDKEEALAVLREVGADVIGLTEVRDEEHAREYAGALGMEYAFAYALEEPPGTLGNALLSRFPIREAKAHLLPHREWQQRAAIEAVVDVGGEDIRFLVTHLTFNARPDKAEQYVYLMDLVRQSSEPVILMGDFNDMENRPNWYSETGYVNIITGGARGTYLGSKPKMFDMHRKVAVREEVNNDPPFHSLRTAWDPPAWNANTISQWLPRVRIDHIYLSPEFYLDHPANSVRVLSPRELLSAARGEDPGYYISDHRPILAEVLIPRPAVELFLNPLDDGPFVLPAGSRYLFRAGAVDAQGNGVSLFANDPDSPADDPRETARMVSLVEWTYDGTGGALESLCQLDLYDPYVRSDRLQHASVLFHASEVGEGTLRVRSGALEKELSVRVLDPEERHTVVQDQ